MMKKLMVLGTIAVMMACAISANAYIIKVSSAAPDGTAAVAAGQISDESTAFAPQLAPVQPEASYALYENNVVGGAMGTMLKMKPAPAVWYGVIQNRGGYSGKVDIRFFSTTTASKLAAGTWYLYKGIAEVSNGAITNGGALALVDTATFATTESDWSKSTFGGQFNAGEQWTLTTLELVPEPGSIVAMLSGLVGLVGFGIRRRK